MSHPPSLLSWMRRCAKLQSFDDTKRYVDILQLSAADKTKIFEGNAFSSSIATGCSAMRSLADAILQAWRTFCSANARGLPREFQKQEAS